MAFVNNHSTDTRTLAILQLKAFCFFVRYASLNGACNWHHKWYAGSSYTQSLSCWGPKGKFCRMDMRPDILNIEALWHFPSTGPYKFATIPFGVVIDWYFRARCLLRLLQTILCWILGHNIGRTVPSMKPQVWFNAPPLASIASANITRVSAESHGWFRSLSRCPNSESILSITLWKVSKYGVFPGLYFPVFGPNAGKNEPETLSHSAFFG